MSRTPEKLGLAQGDERDIALRVGFFHARLRHIRLGLRQSGRSFSWISRFSRRETTSNRKP